MSARSIKPPPLYSVTDHSWHVFGASMVAVLMASGVYCAWRGFSPAAEVPAMEVPTVEVVASPVVFPSVTAPPKPLTIFLPTAAQPLAWQDLTLMLRTGLTDDEIIAAIAGKQLVNTIDAPTVALLRELGAGDRLIRHLQARPMYAPPLSAPAVVVTAPALPRTATPPPPTPPSPVAIDYAARDRQIKGLQKQIDAIDEQIRRLRYHPNDYRIHGLSYNDPDYAGGESMTKNALDYLDRQRNDLRQEKWRLEGR